MPREASRDRLTDLRGGEAQRGGLGPIHLDPEHRTLVGQVVADVGQSVDGLQGRLHLGGGRAERPVVGRDDRDRDVVRGAGLTATLTDGDLTQGRILVEGALQLCDQDVVALLVGHADEHRGQVRAGPTQGGDAPTAHRGQIAADFGARVEHRLDLLGGGAGRRQFRPDRQLHVDLQTRTVGEGADEVGLQQRRRRHGADEDHQRAEHDDQRSADGEPQDGQIAPLQPGHPVLGVGVRVGGDLAALGGAEEPVRQDRHDGQGDQQRRAEGDAHRDCERSQQLTTDPADQGEWYEHGDGGQGRGGDRTGHLLHRGDDRVRSQLRRGVSAFDVLDHHDGVVDHPAHGHREGGQGEDVQREVADPQADHGHQQRERDRDGRDDGGAQGEQEDQDDQDGEGQAEQALGGQVVDRLLDPWGLAEDGDEGRVLPHALRQGRAASRRWSGTWTPRRPRHP